MNPQGIDISAIREALARRASEGSPEAGGVISATDQVSQPGAPLPTGGANVPIERPAQPAPSPEGRAQLGKVVKGAQATTGPNFDTETKEISKALITKLIKYL